MSGFKHWLLVFGLLPLASFAAAAEPNDYVFPKTYPFQLKVGTRISGEVTAIHGLKVIQVRGEWLWVEQQNIFGSEETATGWIQTSEIVDFDAHIRRIDELIRTDPGTLIRYELAARVAQLSHEPRHIKLAISYLSRGMQFDPAGEGYYRLRALCWYRLDQYSRALADAREAQRLEPHQDSHLDAFIGQLEILAERDNQRAAVGMDDEGADEVSDVDSLLRAATETVVVAPH